MKRITIYLLMIVILLSACSAQEEEAKSADAKILDAIKESENAGYVTFSKEQYEQWLSEGTHLEYPSYEDLDIVKSINNGNSGGIQGRGQANVSEDYGENVGAGEYQGEMYALSPEQCEKDVNYILREDLIYEVTDCIDTPWLYDSSGNEEECAAYLNALYLSYPPRAINVSATDKIIKFSEDNAIQHWKEIFIPVIITDKYAVVDWIISQLNNGTFINYNSGIPKEHRAENSNAIPELTMFAGMSDGKDYELMDYYLEDQKVICGSKGEHFTLDCVKGTEYMAVECDANYRIVDGDMGNYIELESYITNEGYAAIDLSKLPAGVYYNDDAFYLVQ